MANRPSFAFQDPDRGELDIPERMTNRYIKRDRLKDMLYTELSKIFRRADNDGDNRLTLEELERHIHKLNDGRKYDNRKIRHLFRELEKHSRNGVTLEEFCHSYSEKIEEYEVKILECKRRIQEVRHEVLDINQQRQE